MKPEVWRRVEGLCQGALELDASERAGFLEHACGHDGELRREVESLLAHEKRAEQGGCAVWRATNAELTSTNKTAKITRRGISSSLRPYGSS
jgi:hypothetical protein